jgi:hypothetical protein
VAVSRVAGNRLRAVKAMAADKVSRADSKVVRVVKRAANKAAVKEVVRRPTAKCQRRVTR